MEFQSLFSWNLPSDISPGKQIWIASLVSILVFVELALGRLGTGPEDNVFLSFNPCFRGTCPRTSYRPIPYLLTSMFQSLFSWNLPSDSIGRSKPTWKNSSFNPCFRGTCPRTVGSIASHDTEVMFQSLFSWNLPSDYIAHIGHCWSTPVSILVFVELALGLQDV